MARRDIEKILNDLGDVRQALTDPTTGFAAVYQDQDAKHRKVLEHVTYSTTGVREENREVRRRLDKLSIELGDTRVAVEALRREIAQAWAHTIGVPRPHTTEAAVGELVKPEPRELTAGTTEETTGGEEANVHEVRGINDRVGRDAAASDDARSGAAGVAAAAAVAADSITGGRATRAEQQSSLEPESPRPDPEPSPWFDSQELAEESPVSDDSTAPDTGLSVEERARQHRQSLLQAAAISSARLVCHKDTWAFLVEQTYGKRHFSLPTQIDDTADGQIETHLSGRSLLAVLVTMHEICEEGTSASDPATWALAAAIERRTRLAVAATALTRPDGAQVTSIVLDDRPDSE